MQRKVFTIGLDGATFDLIKPWIEARDMPNVHRLISNGVSGPLMSTYPPLTGPAWSSFMTGKSPGKHGVLEFFRKKNGSYQQVLNNRLNIDGGSLWKILSNAGIKVGVMGVPLTYPPENVNGFLISGLLTPPNRRDFTSPTELLDEIESNVGKYRLRHDEKYRQHNPTPFIQEQYEILENNTQTAIYLMQNKEWDFFMVHILGTDRMQHEFWHLIDPGHPNHDPDEVKELGNVIRDFFKAVDESVGRMLQQLDEMTAVIVMSDHGFGPVYKFINFNTWLLNEGFLQLKSDLGTRLRYLLFRLGFNYTVLGNLILKLGFGKKAKQLGRAKREDLQRKFFLSLDDVDWSKSKVYSMGNFGQMYINLKGRDPQGNVSPGQEYEAVMEDLIRRLTSMKDPETGEVVIEKVSRSGEVYHGKYSESAPDLTFITRNMAYKAMGLSDFSSNQVFDPVYGTTGHHRLNGILICNQPGIFKENFLVHDAEITDLAPTILYLMGQKIPIEMDGEVVITAFKEEFRKENEVLFSNEQTDLDAHDGYSLTDHEEEMLESVLKSLGYVS